MAVGVEGKGEFVLFEVGEAVDDSEKFADVVCSIIVGTCVKKGCGGIDKDTTVFHSTRVATAGGIDGDGIGDGEFGKGFCVAR